MMLSNIGGCRNVLAGIQGADAKKVLLKLFGVYGVRWYS